MPFQSVFTDEKNPPLGWRLEFGNGIWQYCCVFAISLSWEKCHLRGLALLLWQFNSTLLLCLCYSFSLNQIDIFLHGLTLLPGQPNSTLLLPSQSPFIEKISFWWAFNSPSQFNSIMLLWLNYLSSLMKNYLHRLTLLLRQLNSTLWFRLRNLSLLKWYHLDGFAIVLWQSNSILLLCFCYLPSLLQIFLYGLTRLLHGNSIRHCCCLRSLSLVKRFILMGLPYSFGNLITHCCYAFAISLHWWKTTSMGWHFYFGNSIRHCCCLYNVFFLKRYHLNAKGLVIFLLQFNSILSLCLCYFSSLMNFYFSMDWCFYFGNSIRHCCFA